MSDGEKRDFAATSATPEWFACFQTFFFKVNRQSGHMHVTAAPTTTSPHADAASTAGQTRVRGGGDDAEGMVAGEFVFLRVWGVHEVSEGFLFCDGCYSQAIWCS